ncbi:hypothetical protein IAI18_13085 [Acetobacteraceae bacterium H6797]|nr:hypothetical protein [Acetobacteraceae bacterium H6797]
MNKIGRRAALAGLVAASTMSVTRARAAVVNSAVIGSDGWLFPAWDDVRRFDAARMRQGAALIQQAAGILKAGGIDLAIALTPIKARLYPEFLPNDFRPGPDAEKRYGQTMQELAKSALVPDLAAAMAAAKKAYPQQLLYIKADTHWTAFGAEVCALEVAKAMQGKFRLPASTRPGVQFGQPQLFTQEQNDLAELLPAAQQEAYPPQQFWVRPVVSAGQASLLDDDTADVVVVGNSYMQPKYGFANVLSHTLNRPVALSWKIHRYGPYKTLLTYLQSEPFRRQRPKALVWTFRETDPEFMPDQAGIWGTNAMPPRQFLDDVKKAVG